MVCDRYARCTVVTTHDLQMRYGLVRCHQHSGQFGVNRCVQQRTLSSSRLGDNETVDTPFANPAQDNAGIIMAAQLKAGKHQACIPHGELDLDSWQELRE